ncbi:MAG: hypothetical protein HUU46_02060 [Candidatus Hydrogenedentes bacterium]|nr:hypothetical protein [Candidatus Hydrogenedentota bacterium]
MSSDTRIREYAHKVVDLADATKLRAILELLDDEYFSPEEIREIKELASLEDWVNWREVRRDV